MRAAAVCRHGTDYTSIVFIAVVVLKSAPIVNAIICVFIHGIKKGIFFIHEDFFPPLIYIYVYIYYL